MTTDNVTQERARARGVLAFHTTSPGNPRVCEAVAAMLAYAKEATPSASVERMREALEAKDLALQAVFEAMDEAVRPESGDWQFGFEQTPLWVGDGYNNGYSHLEKITAWEVGPGEAATVCESLNALTSADLYRQVRAALTLPVPAAPQGGE